MEDHAENIRVGFIGCGSHSGENIYPALRPAGLELAAVCDINSQAAKDRAAEYNLGNFYTDFRDMCRAEDLDAVLVAVGPEVHYKCAMALVQAGHHVWTEKPCSVTAAQADEMVNAGQRNGKIIQTGFNYRYTIGIQKAVSLIRSGRFARPGSVRVHWWLGDPDPVHFWHHYMVHAVDLLLYLAGADLAMTHAEHQVRDGRDYYLATFRTPDNDLVLLDLSNGMPIEGHWARVEWHSADGILSVDDFTLVNHYQAHGTEQDSPYHGDHIWRTESMFKKSPFIRAWGYVPELILFREAVRGVRKPEATIAEAAWGMHVCERLLAMNEGRED